MRTKHLSNTLQQALFSAMVLFACSSTALPQSSPHVDIPTFDDAYSKSVHQLESGETNINYREFRDSFLESEQFKVAAKKQTELEALRSSMHEAMKESKYPEIIEVTKKMLSIDYTEMEAHKILQQTYKRVEDAANQKKYHDIEFGLLNSIVKNGDGKTAQTAWPVIQVTEEYFILSMLGAKLLQQSLESNGPCDRMEVETAEGGKRVYFFDVSKVFQGYHKQGIR